MIRHTGTFRDNQARYIRNSNYRSQDYFAPDQIDPHKYDHLVPPMKKALRFTAKTTWFMMKMLIKAAFRIPRLFSKTSPQPQRRKKTSPATAFPGP
ncbi:MAG TPA: hypothetical protein VHC48_11655 [Puia sp.]|jgi:hypothetical protein|nr:hypothetical protein [Puia sp.]